MPKCNLTGDQMKAVVSELAAGRAVREVSRRYHVSTGTLYRWRAALERKPQPARTRLRVLEAEHRRLKQQLAELRLDYSILRAALLKDVKGDC